MNSRLLAALALATVLARGVFSASAAPTTPATAARDKAALDSVSEGPDDISVCGW